MRVLLTSLLLLLLSPPVAAQSRVWTFVTEPFPPFSSAADAAADSRELRTGAGPFALVIRQACLRLQWSCRIDVYPWRRALSAAEKGEVDGIYSVVDNPERQHAFYLSPFVVRSHYGLFIREEASLTYRQPADLAGRVVAAYGPSGTSALVTSLLPQMPGATFQMEPDNIRLLKKLAAGRYGPQGVVVLNADVAHYLLRHEAIQGVKEVGMLAPIAYAIGLSRNGVMPAEAALFTDTLLAMLRSGELARLVQSTGVQPAMP